MADRSFDLLLLRHGLTDSNQNGIVQGHLPIPLNETGRRQAAQLAARLARMEPKLRTLVSSDLIRAEQTARAIADATGIEPIFDPAWRERGLGELEGKAVGEKLLWQAASGENSPTGAETVADFHARVHRAMLALPQRFAHQSPVAVVTHGGTMRVVLRVLADGALPLAANESVPEVEAIDNCSIWPMQYRGGAWHILSANDVAHLEQAIHTTDAG